MSLKKFETNDIYTNRIKTHPRSYFLLNNGTTYYNHDVVPILTGTKTILHAPQGYLSLHELNINRAEPATLIYPFITKQGSLESFKTVSTEAFQGFSYGDEITGSYESSSASISNEYFAPSAARSRITALKNTFNHYRSLSHHYAFKTNDWDKATQAIRLISIPSIFYGSSIKKGSLKLNCYDQGDLVATLEDRGRNGELIQTVGPVPASVAATGSIEVGSSSMMFENYRVRISPASGASKFFIFSNTLSDGSTGTVDGSGRIVVQLSDTSGGGQPDDVAKELRDAINGVSGFGVTAVYVPPGESGDDGVALTQNVAGAAGNTSIDLFDESGNSTSMFFTISGFGGGSGGVSTNDDVGKVAGVVLYNEGFIALTGSWDIGVGAEMAKKWYEWGTAAANPTWDIDFLGTNYIPTITMFAHAKLGELNNSTNPTFIDFADRNDNQEEVTLSSNKYVEDTELTISNVVKSEHSSVSGSFEKTTYISKIGIYDEHKNLIGIAKLATPVKKTESRSYTFKMKLDF